LLCLALVLCLSLLVFPTGEALAQTGAQTGTVAGTVTDSTNGTTLPGVNISIVGTQLGDATGADGQYEIGGVPVGAQTLEFSFVGYQTRRVDVEVEIGMNEVNVELAGSAVALEDVVVTALGIEREERSVGYAVQEVDGEDLTYTDENNVIGSLAGKIAGARVVGSSGASLGGTSTIKIRGVNTLSGEGQPLIVVDGTPISNGNFAGYTGRDYGNLAQDINPNDVKSVNVLKGPSASALYGIRGQHGVVMITTKDGAGANDFRVTVNSGFAAQQATNFMDFQNKYGGGYTQEWKTLANGDKYVEAHADESWGPKLDGTMVREFPSFYPQDPQFGELTPFDAQPNNIQNFFESGYRSSQGITVAGGAENSNYRLSFNDTRVSGVVPNTRLRRNNLGLSAGIDVSDQWRFTTNLNYATNDAKRPYQGSQGGSRYFRQWFQRNVEMSELKDYKYDDGTIKHWNLFGYGGSSTPYAGYWSNPYFLANESPTLDGRNRVFGNVGVAFSPLSNVTISGYIRGDMYVQDIENMAASGGAGTAGYAVSKYENQEMNYELKAQYDETWGDFSFDATLGSNVYDEDYSFLAQNTVGGLTSPGYFNIQASVDRPDNTSYQQEKRIISGYGLASLGYKDTYYLEASLRNDRSSTLPKDNNSYWYPSVAGSFVFSELLDWEPLSFAKLRASFARAGTDLGPYQTTQSFGVGNQYGGINTLFVPNNLDNPDIKPSFSNAYEAGIDFNLYDRFEVNFTYYLQRTENQIIPLDISGTSGYNTATINAGLIKNQGVELSLSGTPVQNESFSWNTGLNLARNRNEVVRLHPDIDVYTHGSTTYSGVTSYMNSYVGEEYGVLVGKAYQRDEATGKILLDDNNLPLYTDATERFGSVLPDLAGGFRNVVRFMDFSLSAMLDFQVGGQFFSRSSMLAAKTGLTPETAALNDKGNNVRDPLEKGGGVKVEGISKSTGEDVTAYVDARSYYNGVLGTHVYEEWVMDASYVKLSEVSLGYDISSDLLGSLPVRSAGISLYVNNPVMIWQAAPQGLDPSALSSGSTDLTWFESGQLNSTRTFGMKLNLVF
jgi:TonB-linked SusC/RagA family outer membrane protein